MLTEWGISMIDSREIPGSGAHLVMETTTPSRAGDVRPVPQAGPGGNTRPAAAPNRSRSRDVSQNPEIGSGAHLVMETTTPSRAGDVRPVPQAGPGGNTRPAAAPNRSRSRDVSQNPEIPTPVLLWLPSSGREASVRETLASEHRWAKVGSWSPPPAPPLASAPPRRPGCRSGRPGRAAA